MWQKTVSFKQKKIERNRPSERVITIIFVNFFLLRPSNVLSACTGWREVERLRCHSDNCGRQWIDSKRLVWWGQMMTAEHCRWRSRKGESTLILSLATRCVELLVQSVSRTQPRTGGVAMISGSRGRRGPAARERCLLERIVWLFDWWEVTPHCL